MLYLEESDSAMDDSTSSTFNLFGGDGSDEEFASLSTKDKIRKVIRSLRKRIKKLFVNSTYDLNVITDDNNRKLYETNVCKGENGIGLDIAKVNNETVVTGFKDSPTWASNPSRLCKPEINVGDCIVGINHVSTDTFAKVVNTLKELPQGDLTLHLRRPLQQGEPMRIGGDSAL